MIDLKYIVDPIIGTLIGFGTNYIAVKMLFRPYNKIKIGKFTLPFTPGVIPKRKEEIAKSLGNTISKELFTSNDIKEIFLSDEIKDKVSNTIIFSLKQNKSSIKDLLVKNIGEDKYLKLKSNLEDMIINKISEGLLKIDISNIILTEGTKIVKQKLKESFFGSFISEDKISKMAEPIGKTIENYLKNNLNNLVLPYIDDEFSNLENKNLEQILNKLEISDEKLKITIEKIYTKIVEEKMQMIFDSLEISKVIQNKINNMDVKEIEILFMSVMKKELNAIVNLGAVLGFLLGLVNAFIL